MIKNYFQLTKPGSPPLDILDLTKPYDRIIKEAYLYSHEKGVSITEFYGYISDTIGFETSYAGKQRWTIPISELEDDGCSEFLKPWTRSRVGRLNIAYNITTGNLRRLLRTPQYAWYSQ